ncbi:MAG: hypothetical protein IPH03_08575 [Tetrasphaera sp.]|nr:hypothetical protein [Tetrasphaera sp.]
MISAANAKGMRIILDGVFNHTSSDSVYFDRYHHWSTDGACESTASSYRPWYEWNDSVSPCTSASYNGWFGYDSWPSSRTTAAPRATSSIAPTPR